MGGDTGGAKTPVRLLAHQEIQQDVTFLATATYLALKDGYFFMLILKPIFQPCQLILQDVRQQSHLQLADTEIHRLKSFPQHLNLSQSVGVVLHLLDNVNKLVDRIPVLLNHVPKGCGLMGLEGSLPTHLQHFQLHPTNVFDIPQRVLANLIHRITHLLEVLADLLEEPSPLLLSCCLRNQLRHC